MAIKITQDINFKVESIKEANKKGFAVVAVKFDGNDTVYTYVRKYNDDLGGVLSTLIDGCRISFKIENGNATVLSIERVYETKGRHRRSTATLTGERGQRKGRKVSDAIKEEAQAQGIEEPVKPTQTEEVKDGGEVKHEKSDMIEMCLKANIPVYLAGPAGVGKNYTVEQIAKNNGWDFYFSNSVQQEYKLTGFIDAGGKYHETEFYKACTCGKECVFFLDEMDASIPEVLVLLNAAIANGYFEFPCGRVDFDKVHFVAAGNTVGSGSDDMYTGRMVLDSATLDRFAIVDFYYDKRIEMMLSNNNSELVDFIHDMRKQATEKGIRATFSYRCITMVTKLEKMGMALSDILKISVFKGLDKDTLRTFEKNGDSAYYRCLNKIQM